DRTRRRTRDARSPASTRRPPDRSLRTVMKASCTSPSPSLLFRFGLRVLGLAQPCAAQDVAHRVVALVTRVFVQMILSDRPGVFAGPRLLPRLRLVDREPVLQRLRVGAREPLGDREVFGRAAEPR